MKNKVTKDRRATKSAPSPQVVVQILPEEQQGLTIQHIFRVQREETWTMHSIDISKASAAEDDVSNINSISGVAQSM